MSLDGVIMDSITCKEKRKVCAFGGPLHRCRNAHKLPLHRCRNAHKLSLSEVCVFRRRVFPHSHILEDKSFIFRLLEGKSCRLRMTVFRGFKGANCIYVFTLQDTLWRVFKIWLGRYNWVSKAYPYISDYVQQLSNYNLLLSVAYSYKLDKTPSI